MIKYVLKSNYYLAGLILLLTINFIGCNSDEKLSKEQLLLQSIEQLEQRFESRKLTGIRWNT